MNKTKYELTRENVFLKMENNKLRIENRKLKEQLSKDKKSLFIPMLDIFYKKAKRGA